MQGQKRQRVKSKKIKILYEIIKKVKTLGTTATRAPLGPSLVIKKMSWNTEVTSSNLIVCEF